MKMKQILVIAISLTIPSVFAQNFTVEQLAATVVMLKKDSVKTVIIDGVKNEVWLKPEGGKPAAQTESAFGSGFLVSTKNNKLFLVTASHVAHMMDQSSIVVFRGSDGRTVEKSLAEFSGHPIQAEWIFHPVADVAVLTLAPSDEFAKRFLEKHFVPVETLVEEKQAPSRDNGLTFMGFPLGLGVLDDFSPLTRGTRAASGLVKLRRADTHTVCTFFVSENPSIQGFSGGPCFDVGIYTFGAMTATSGMTRCVGIIHATVSDETGGQMALITPAFYVVESINTANK